MHTQRYGQFRVVGIYGVAHALVDASCATLLFSAIASGRLPVSQSFVAVLGYSLFAFALQPILGWFVNELHSARIWACVGALTTSIAFFVGCFSESIWLGVMMAGIGNAAFHVGGGVVSLQIDSGKATAPGLFVAPGAAGLAAGIAMGTHLWYSWFPALALLLIVPLMGRLPEKLNHQQPRLNLPMTALSIGIVGVLLAVVTMRAFVGSGLKLPWKSDPVLLVFLTAAVVLGKAAGGVLADRFGRSVIGVGALCIAAPLLAIAPKYATAGIMGALLFNMTMPVTLVAVTDLLRERSGFAFGLTCLALIVGSLPISLSFVSAVSPKAIVFGVLGSAALLWFGLFHCSQGYTTLTQPKALEEI